MRIGESSRQDKRYRLSVAPFVEREGEMDMLLDLVARAEAGRGQVVGREVLDLLGGVGLAERNLGRLALAAGTHAEAATHLATARDLFAGMGSPHEVARTTLALAALAHARGDTAQAAALLAEARVAFEALGMPALVARADHLARGRAPPPGGDEGARLSTVA